MESHRGLLSEDDNDEEIEVDRKKKENKNVLNLMHDKHFDKLPGQLDWRDYGQCHYPTLNEIQ